MTSTDTLPIVRTPLYRRRWFLWVVGAAAVLVIAAGITVFASFLAWRNSPESALLDATQYAMKTPGSYHISAHDVDLTVITGNQRYGLNGTVRGVPIAAVLYGGMLYVKSSQPDKLYGMLMNTQPNEQLQTAIQAIAQTLKDKWIMINLQNTKLQAGQAQGAQCLVQAKDSLANNPHAWNEVQSVYLTHRFVGASNAGGGAFNVSLDGARAGDFLNALFKTDFYHSLTDCASSTVPATGMLNNLQATVTLSPQRSLQSVTARSQGKTTAVLTASYKDVPAIDLPTDSVSLDQLVVRYLQSFTSFL